MALLQPFLCDTSLSKTLHFSHPYSIPKRTTLTTPKTRTVASLQPPLKSYHYHRLRQLKKQWTKCYAIAETGGGVSVEGDDNHGVLVSQSSEEEMKGDRVVVDYDWTEEWYPLYLTRNIPDDAPLGLTVFDKQLVLYRDGNGDLRCYQDRCPHRLAKLSEGQLFGGRLECLYHGWQFDGDGKCIRIPQLPTNSKIPLSACVKTYEVRDSQGVVWVWMSHKTPSNPNKLPWFENFARPGFQDVSTTHEFHMITP
ncbi:hypothetical protein F0562_012142 [Nyssa sinensis]|uniref:Rieske domain-containing protein n=1 Tax=Nyssa sinensis TaxID=561372 RepID=A0A5J4ZTR1_9ASTE|nr:hypothetical protein F0562_012142 [Nyssa sinensis]